MQTTVAVLIPAYKPDERMLRLIDELKALGFERLIVIDDGSGETYAPLFERASAAGAAVLAHPVNRGKGAALRTGLAHILEGRPCPVVTVDADGQHAPGDVLKVAQKLLEAPEALVLGVRDKSQMPPRSKFGNTLTCWTLGAISGLWIDDTQTGLRGLPAGALEALSTLSGDRYEYEMSMLLHARRERMPVEQVVIETIYIDNNRGSSFRVLRDSVRIYVIMLRQLLAFLGSSAVTAAIDLLLFTVLHIIYPDLLMVAVVAARVTSATVNYIINKNVVFKSPSGLRSAVRYYTLVCVMVILSYLIIRALGFIRIPTVVAKVIGDGLLLIFNYQAQRHLVFKVRRKKDA
jgi:glycosyltransferase involved in cell wall biosynthesis